jgi:hypothetical protein
LRLPETRFLFWNLNRKPLSRLVADLAEEHRSDIVVLAESAETPTEVLQALNRLRSAFEFPFSECDGLLIFTRFPAEFVKPVFESSRVSIRHLTLPASSPVLLAAAHLPSKLHWSQDSQSSECGPLARRIQEEEKAAGHQRTILLGDFNMNPFERGMVGAEELHSVMSRKVAVRGTRTVQGRPYTFFYNPMWGHFGDLRGDVAGTYFYSSAEHMNFYWNLFDQVLLRPELAARFAAGSLKIVQSVGAASLCHPDGRPNRQTGSDHLPIVFAVEL